MSNRQRNTRVTDGKNEILVQDTHTDSPLIPVAHFERIHAFRPDLVDWVVSETTKEAEHRRNEHSYINKSVTRTNLIGQLMAFTIGITAIIGGLYATMNGHSEALWLSGTAITALAVAFLRN